MKKSQQHLAKASRLPMPIVLFDWMHFPATNVFVFLSPMLLQLVLLICNKYIFIVCKTFSLWNLTINVIKKHASQILCIQKRLIVCIANCSILHFFFYFISFNSLFLLLVLLLQTILSKLKPIRATISSHMLCNVS